MDGKKSKSFEEREQNYNQARARIFNEEVKPEFSLRIIYNYTISFCIFKLPNPFVHFLSPVLLICKKTIYKHNLGMDTDMRALSFACHSWTYESNEITEEKYMPLKA